MRKGILRRAGKVKWVDSLRDWLEMESVRSLAVLMVVLRGKGVVRGEYCEHICINYVYIYT